MTGVDGGAGGRTTKTYTAEENAAYYATLYRIYVATAMLVRDTAGRVLLVKPSYRHHWQLPGGILDAGETPAEGCEREVREEVGLLLRAGRLLAVDYRPAAEDDGRPESLAFTFDGGVLDDAAVSSITVDGTEIVEARFMTRGEAVAALDASGTARFRLGAALDALDGTAVYLEGGRPRGSTTV